MTVFFSSLNPYEPSIVGTSNESNDFTPTRTLQVQQTSNEKSGIFGTSLLRHAMRWIFWEGPKDKPFFQRPESCLMLFLLNGF